MLGITVKVQRLEEVNLCFAMAHVESSLPAMSALSLSLLFSFSLFLHFNCTSSAVSKSTNLLLEEMDLFFISLSKFTISAILLAFLLSSFSFTSTEAYDALDPNGHISIKWDVLSWTPDGYVAVVSIYNFQQYRHIPAPGWTLGWTWAKNEVIWSAMGSQATEQGDCSRFKRNIPHSCQKKPVIVDLLPGTPYNQQIGNCCKAGVLTPWGQDPKNAVSSFQLSVGAAGTTKETVQVPRNFTLNAPGPGYTCGPAKIVKPTTFITPDGRRMTRAQMTWNVTCTYSQFLAQKTPTCCVSLSSLYSKTIAPCPTCSYGCQNNTTRSCVKHTCPIQVNWHVKLNNKDYWRVKVTIKNLNSRKKYPHWNLVVQHPNFDNLKQLFSLNYKSVTPYGSINDTAMLWGVKSNEILRQAGPLGNVQAELLFRKKKSTFTLEKGWAFPQRIYFNGDNCVMPPPDAYPRMPNASLH